MRRHGHLSKQTSSGFDCRRLFQFANQVDILSVENSVHVNVCVKMRAKLVSEVRANLEKLQVSCNPYLT